ncbi:transcriptional regulator, GntR family [Peptacetobacter hiranonis DSM 13275]|uniref:Transcriptional regulator, GntR family n=2 Tax=Peptostreptococcaceae TaxID=186804 RepID=B6FZI4_PEPHT|nr:transcriptional regulator, GntR family [Peptacetobacter hiranonis DSM 13275]
MRKEDPMKFVLNGEEPIFIQIARAIEDEILIDGIGENEQVPSTTEISKTYEINPATVLKGMNILVDQEILYKKRGRGMFVAEGAKEIIKKARKEKFINESLVSFMEEAKKLGISREELIDIIRKE